MGKKPYRKPPIKCVFCGSRPIPPKKLTGEHVFPRWSHAYLPPRVKRWHSLEATAELTKTMFWKTTRGGDPRDWKVHVVCAPCNNVWMSNLETAVKPILLKLITWSPSDSPLRLMEREQKLIAGWVALKAMVAEYGPGSRVTTHQRYRLRMKVKHLPPEHGWRIWIGYYERKAWKPFWVGHPMAIFDKPKPSALPDDSPSHYNSHVSTQVIGKLFIHVLRSPDHVFIRLWKFPQPAFGRLRQIWPVTGISILWPPQVMTDADADYVAGAVTKYAEVVMREKIFGPLP